MQHRRCDFIHTCKMIIIWGLSIKYYRAHVCRKLCRQLENISDMYCNHKLKYISISLSLSGLLLYLKFYSHIWKFWRETFVWTKRLKAPWKCFEWSFCFHSSCWCSAFRKLFFIKYHRYLQAKHGFMRINASCLSVLSICWSFHLFNLWEIMNPELKLVWNKAFRLLRSNLSYFFV